jgi:hypothetical protein
LSAYDKEKGYGFSGQNIGNNIGLFVAVVQEGVFVNFCFQQSNILIVNVMDVMNCNQAMFMMIMVRHFVCVSVKRLNTFFFSKRSKIGV